MKKIVCSCKDPEWEYNEKIGSWVCWNCGEKQDPKKRKC